MNSVLFPAQPSPRISSQDNRAAEQKQRANGGAVVVLCECHTKCDQDGRGQCDHVYCRPPRHGAFDGRAWLGVLLTRRGWLCCWRCFLFRLLASACRWRQGIARAEFATGNSINKLLWGKYFAIGSNNAGHSVRSKRSLIMSLMTPAMNAVVTPVLGSPSDVNTALGTFPLHISVFNSHGYWLGKVGHQNNPSILNGSNVAGRPTVVKGRGATMHRDIHPAVSFFLGGMNVRGGAATPPRTTGQAPGDFHAEHHGTAEHQNRADVGTWRGLRAEVRPTSAITGARAGARGGFSRHRQQFSGGAAHG